MKSMFGKKDSSSRFISKSPVLSRKDTKLKAKDNIPSKKIGDIQQIFENITTVLVINSRKIVRSYISQFLKKCVFCLSLMIFLMSHPKLV